MQWGSEHRGLEASGAAGLCVAQQAGEGVPCAAGEPQGQGAPRCERHPL